MGFVVKKNTDWAVVVEDTEGVYKAPSSSSEFVQTLTDGSEMTPSKETIERGVSVGSIGHADPMSGILTVAGALVVEAKAAEEEGAAPDYDALMRSIMGSKRTVATTTTTLSGNTDSRLYVPDASVFKKHDIILIKEAGRFHVSPIAAVVEGEGEADDYIDLEFAGSAAFSTGVVIGKFTRYNLENSGHPSLSITEYLENEKFYTGVGCKAISLALENFATGQIPNFNFAFEGLKYNGQLGTKPVPAVYTKQKPPVILGTCVKMDGEKIDANEFAATVENTTAFATSTCAENGRFMSRATDRVVTGSFNPFMKSDSMANWTKFKNNTPFSVFTVMRKPSTVAGEFGGIVAVFMPNCIMSEIGRADQDGLVQEAINFTATRGEDGTTPEIIIVTI